MGACKICSHENRSEIENAILNMHSQSGTSIEEIAKEFGVTANDLKIHMIMHSTMGHLTDAQQSESLARKCKLREADMLEATATEYMVTLKALGRRINGHLQNPEVTAEKLITKPITDMYLGLGGEIRATVSSIAELDKYLNGPKEDAQGGLGALATAIQQSAQMVATGTIVRPSGDEQ